MSMLRLHHTVLDDEDIHENMLHRATKVQPVGRNRCVGVNIG